MRGVRGARATTLWLRIAASVATALRYFDLNLGWRPVSIAGRLTARRLPDESFEPGFTDFKPFQDADGSRP